MESASAVGNQTAGIRLMTMLYCDIEGSTRILRRAASEYGNLLARHRAIVRGALPATASEQGTEGDSFLILFDQPAQACRAALEIQRGLSGAGWPEGCEIAVRIGIHTGEVQQGPAGWTGLAIHETARIGSAAHGSQTLVSETTRSLALRSLPDDAVFIDLGPQRLKDLDEPIRLFQLGQPDLAADFPPPRSLAMPRHNLPANLSSFVGRVDDLAAITKAAIETRLLTLVGPGGTGKTRLALQVGELLLDESRDGVWFTDLSPVTDGTQVAAAVATALTARQDAGESSLDAIVRQIAHRELTLIIDNCEHVVEACSLVIDHVLRACPASKVLATSRMPLDLGGEVLYRVGQLTIPPSSLVDPGQLASYDSVQLLLDRARASGAVIELDAQTAPKIVAICRGLDGIPLALELAAGRLRTMSLDDFARRLDQRLRLLTGGRRSAPERQQTLRAAIDWSYQSLPVSAQLLFSKLSVFAGAWDLDGIDAICMSDAGDSFDVLDLHALLVDNSLVQSHDIGGVRRFDLLGTVQDHAAGCLATYPDAVSEQVVAAHRDYYVSLLEQAGGQIAGRQQRLWMGRLDMEIANIREALARSLVDPAAAAKALSALASSALFWRTRGFTDPIMSRRLLLPVADLGPDDPIQIEARLLLADDLGDDLASPESQDTSRQLLDEGLVAARRIGDARLEATALHFLCWREYIHRRASEARAYATQALAIAERLGNDLLVGSCCLRRSGCGPDPGNVGDAMRALMLFRGMGNESSCAMALDRLAIAEADAGDWVSSRQHLAEALAIYDELGIADWAAIARLNVGLIWLNEENAVEAWPALLACLQYFRYRARLDIVGVCLLGLACCCGLNGRLDAAVKLHGTSEAILAGIERGIDPDERRLRDSSLERLTASLGQFQVQDWLRIGGGMSVAEAAALAMGGLA